MRKVYNKFTDEYIDESEKSPYAPPERERYTKMLGENIAKWLLKRLLKEEVDRKTEPQIDIHDLTDCDFCKNRNCKNCEGGKNEPTAEERKVVADYIDSISIPTGVNVFDLMDESQMERNK